MSNYEPTETIAAISTPRGSGGIAVVRISGGRAVSIADQIFRGRVTLADADSHRANLGKIWDGGPLDQGLVTVFRAPNSYTSEDVVEISCHGGYFLTRRVLELLLDRGARLANPGEFTQRAFVNGKLDLSQAEAVGDIIAAKTRRSLMAAVNQFEGALSRQVDALRRGLIELCSLLELELDFSEEDIDFANRGDLDNRLSSCTTELQSLLATFNHGRLLRDGVRLVIVGKPNVGKSSLLNALLRDERAIVTEYPGTTRDVIEEQMDIQGVYFRIMDTAGIRDSADAVEVEGVRRSHKEVRGADIVMLVFDGSTRLDEDDLRVIQQVLPQSGAERRLAVINKCDLQSRLDERSLTEAAGELQTLRVSATEPRGLDVLENTLVACAMQGVDSDASEPVLSNLRQKQAVERSLASLSRVRSSFVQELSGEFLALDLREAITALGEILGEVTTEDILDSIFSKFCIGK